MITVCNIRGKQAAFRAAEKEGRAVYIGRAMPRLGLVGSPLGNPYRLEHGDTTDTRLIVLGRYKRWLIDDQLYGVGAVAQEFERLCKLARAGDLDLYCWCAPRICHGDVVKELIEAMNAEVQQ